MKERLLLICIFVMCLGCSSDSDSEPSDCGSVTLTGVQQEGNILTFNYQTQNTFNYYEIVYDQTGSIGNLNNQSNVQSSFNNSFTTTDIATTSITDETLNFYAENNQTLSFYIRAQCQNGNFTLWQGPIILQINAYCDAPYDFSVQNGTAYWDTYYNETDASYFQVEYGNQGFVLGSGNVLTTNSESTSDASLASGNAYDFYVRAFCNNNLGFSNWEGPVSYYAEYDQNLCNEPSGVTVEVERNGFGEAVGAVFRWEHNGESNFEHVVVSNNQSPESGNINTSDDVGWPFYNLAQNTNYDFYIRAVCLDGARTEWVGPRNVNIGS
tara:strand:- start:473 stop:1447 length:975 start_codon:yes stop_codon:yes gene_type:complete